MNRIPLAPPVCPACGETTGTTPTIGSFHAACVDRLLTRQRRHWERGASMIEYVMLMAFVAVFAIVGLRAIGPVAADMFNVERLGLAPAAVPTEVLGTTLERHTRFDRPVPAAWAMPIRSAQIPPR